MPALWGIFSIGTITACELYVAKNEIDWVDLLRYVAATTTLCPAVAILGAKRPQDSGWKFIVASLWLVLILPAIQTALFGSTELELHWAWRYFLLVLLIACWSNYVLTKFWFAASMFLASQVVLFGSSVPGVPFAVNDQSVAIAITVGASAGIVVLWQSRKPAPNGIERVWRDFRDSFGTVWGLRIMELFNTAGSSQKWSQSLSWSGLVRSGQATSMREDAESADEDATLANEAEQMEQTLRVLLRRFVDSEWIDKRLK